MRHARGDNGQEIMSAVAAGLKVYDADGELVGTVDMVDLNAGTMRVQTNPFFEEPLVIPLALVKSIYPRELFLLRVRAELSPDGREGSA
ncbi:MAG TPA: PRC-barrel domain-containing protein [Candidatus Dormibacteraeota bacterium]|nr:PRC-barrel domain-containing protein [Candidatus Dormibacteraeota bacterium]